MRCSKKQFSLVEHTYRPVVINPRIADSHHAEAVRPALAVPQEILGLVCSTLYHFTFVVASRRNAILLIAAICYLNPTSLKMDMHGPCQYHIVCHFPLKCFLIFFQRGYIMTYLSSFPTNPSLQSVLA